jgi:hypothetical protein
MKFRLFFLVAILANLPAKSIFTELYHWQSTGKKNKKTIVFAGDYHTECSNFYKAQEHQDAIIDMALEQGAHVIAEDMGTYDGTIRAISKISGPAEDMAYDCPLLYLISRCRDEGIKVSNLEVRHATTKLVEAIESDREYLFELLDEISFEEIIDNLWQAINEIANYQDKNPVLQEEYAAIVNQFMDAWPRLEYLVSKIKEMIKALRKNPKASIDFNILNEFYRFDNPLVDAKLLHELYVHRKKKNIIVCVGCAHYWNIRHILPSLGFDLINSEIKEPKIVVDAFKKTQLIAESSAIDFENFFSDKPNIVQA